MMNFLMTPASEITPDLVAQETSDQHRARLDAAARAQGFPSFEAYRVWEAQRSRKRAPQTTTSAGLPQSVDQAKQQVMAMHPATILNYITEKLKQATGN